MNKRVNLPFPYHGLCVHTMASHAQSTPKSPSPSTMPIAYYTASAQDAFRTVYFVVSPMLAMI